MRLWRDKRPSGYYPFALLTVAGAFTMGCNRSGPDDPVRVRAGGQDFVLAPAGASEARVRAVLPLKGSEDVSHLLGSFAPPDRQSRDEGKRDYLPDPAVDWVIDVRIDGDPRMDPRQVSDLFGAEWRKRHGGLTIFGLDPNAGRWTFLISADGPKQVTRLKLAWDFLDPIDDDAELPTATVFSAREVAVREAVRVLGAAEVRTSLAPAEAVARARSLRVLKARLDYSPTLVLRAPDSKVFEGQTIWDVMLCLGLKWGDMDVFHWENPDGAGDDHLFSVWTTTPPGYFLPEEVAAGRVRASDLVFGFSAPRCSQPGPVFEAMARAAEYARKRLGGTLTDPAGGAAGLEAIRRTIRSVEDELKSNGFTAGGDGALRLF